MAEPMYDRMTLTWL